MRTSHLLELRKIHANDMAHHHLRIIACYSKYARMCLSHVSMVYIASPPIALYGDRFGKLITKVF